MSEKSELNIHQRILAIMGELHYIEKEKKTVNGQYRFVSHDSVVSKVQKMLVKHRVTTASSIHEIIQDGNCTRVKLNVSFINPDSPTDFFTVQFAGYGVDNGDKGPGKAVSYAYKYALLKVLNLETGDDPDYDAKAEYEPEKCIDFDYKFSLEMNEKDKEKLRKFIEATAIGMNKHVEDVKREAVARPEAFMKAFQSWSSKKGKE